jgi:hypothetical protein
VDLAEYELVELHRRGLLVPLFQIHARRVDNQRRFKDERTVSAVWPLLIAAQEGRLSDPATRRYRELGPAGRSMLRYSQHQLLAVRSLPWLMSQMKYTRSNDNVDAELPRFRSIDESIVQSWFAKDRALAVLLDILSPRYLPRVRGQIRSYSSELGRYINEDDPVEERRLIKVKPNDLKIQAEHLLRSSSFFDPLGEWHRVVRIANANRWEKLRLDALLAQEHRVAAELLLRYIEDLAALGRAPALEPVSSKWREARHDRIEVDHRERAETVLDFQLSDRPALVLALEGATELAVVPRILERIGVDDRSGLIDLVDLHGVDGDVRLLARAVAVPRLDPEGHLGARILAPLTALVIAVDPEGRYQTPEKCSQIRERLVAEVLGALPRTLRTPAIEADLRHLLHIFTWGEASFEFAHFTNQELARAIRRCAPSEAPPLAKIRESVDSCRARKGNLKQTWQSWAPKLSKTALAEELWPVLEQKLSSPASATRLPVVRVLNEVVQIAVRVRPVREMGVEPRDDGSASPE